MSSGRLAAALALAAACALTCGDEATRRNVRSGGGRDAGTDVVLDAGPRPDGGPDQDAGPGLDGGPSPDAGPDGDAGPLDSGPLDAGPQDSGPRDAGPQDAGPGDAGPRDAGPGDAGPGDAGTCQEAFINGPTKALDDWPADAAWIGEGWAAVLVRAFTGAPCIPGVDGLEFATSVMGPSGTDATLPVKLEHYCTRSLRAQPVAIVSTGRAVSGREGSLALASIPAVLQPGTWAYLISSTGARGSSVKVRDRAVDFVTLARGDNDTYAACWNEDSNTDGYLDVWCAPLAGISILTAGAAVLVADGRGLSNDRGTFRPALARGNGEYGLVYVRALRRGDGSTDGDLYFARLDSTTAQRIGGDVPVIATTADVARNHLAWNGTEYGLAYRHWDGSYSLKFARLSSVGAVIGTPITVTSEPYVNGHVLPRVSWTAGQWTIGWTLTNSFFGGDAVYLARVSGAGALESLWWLGSVDGQGSYVRALNPAVPTAILYDGYDGTYVGTVGCP